MREFLSELRLWWRERPKVAALWRKNRRALTREEVAAKLIENNAVTRMAMQRDLETNLYE